MAFRAPGASLHLAGAQVASSYAGGDDLAALDDVSFDWGRQEIFGFAEPGVMTCTLIDRTGRYAAGTSLDGLQVILKWVGTTSTRNRFNGRVTAWSSERRIVQNPQTGDREPVWFVTITAASLLAGPAKAYLTGPSQEYTGQMPAGDPELDSGGEGGWPRTYLNNRINAMTAAGLSSFLEYVQGVPNEFPNGATPYQAALRREEAGTALEMIQNVYATQFYRPDFNPEYTGGAIIAAEFLRSSPLVLARANGLVVVQANGVTSVPANRVAVPDGIQAQSTVADGIDFIEQKGYLSGFKSTGDNTSGVVKKPLQRTVTVPGGTPSRGNTLVCDYTMPLFYSPYSTSASYPWAAGVNAWWYEWARRMVALADEYRNKLRLPVLRFDTVSLPLATEALTELVHRPLAGSLPIYFPGSVFNVLDNAGPQYQIIGGTVRYRDGRWTHDVRVIPVRSGALAAPLSMEQLFGRSSATLAQWSPELRLGDLATVSQGLTT